MGFYEWLAETARRNDSLLCVGLDPQVGPPGRQAGGEELFELNRRIVDATRDLVCCYKPNFAFYEAAGPAGLQALQQTIRYIHDTAAVPVILDAKRGDIGSTAEAYARAAFDVWGADALTVNPYLGGDSIAPFTARADRGAFVLCHTSNPGAVDLQTLPCPARPLYEMVARKAAEWGTGLVVGATYPQALARVRALAPEAWILLPGVGAQGGDLYEALAAGLRDDGLGVIVNSSRGIVQAADPGQAARDLKLQINAVRAAFRQAREARPSLLRELAVALADIGAVKFGEFVLASGKTSPVYVDLRLLASYPGVLRLAGHAYADLLGRELGVGGESLDVVLAAIPYAALPIGTAVSLETGLPLIYPRKEAKSHGTGRAIEGEFRPGDRAVVLDDVITTGGSKLQAIEPLAAAGLKVEDVIVLIDREQGGREELEAAGYRLHAVLRLSEMLDMLVEAGKIDEGQRRGVLEYLRAQ
jgi:uridine monophosphate synthetase